MSSLPDNYIINFNYKTVLNAYKKGMFPMAESAESTDVFWVEPENRGVIYLKEAKTPKRLKRFLKKKLYLAKIFTPGVKNFRWIFKENR